MTDLNPLLLSQENERLRDRCLQLECENHALKIELERQRIATVVAKAESECMWRDEELRSRDKEPPK